MTSIINVGSTNLVKVDAVREVVQQYTEFEHLPIHSAKVNSDVSDQPRTLEETIRGAQIRASRAFAISTNCVYGFGIESGLMKVPKPLSITGHLDFCACVIYDGKRYTLGTSCGFEFPTEIIKLIEERGVTSSQAYKLAGLTDVDDIGSLNGIIGLLTNDKITRTEYTKQAVHMALIPLRNKDLYPHL